MAFKLWRAPHFAGVERQGWKSDVVFKTELSKSILSYEKLDIYQRWKKV
jgi:hypothetical protein